MYLKGSTRDYLMFNSWFSSKKSAEADASIGVDLIGMVKNQHQIIFQGYDIEVDKLFFWRILHCVEEHPDGTRGKAATCYRQKRKISRRSYNLLVQRGWEAQR